MQNALLEHSTILLTFIKLPFVLKTFDLSIFEWPLKTGYTVYETTVNVLKGEVGALYLADVNCHSKMTSVMALDSVSLF